MITFATAVPNKWNNSSKSHDTDNLGTEGTRRSLSHSEPCCSSLVLFVCQITHTGIGLCSTVVLVCCSPGFSIFCREELWSLPWNWPCVGELWYLSASLSHCICLLCCTRLQLILLNMLQWHPEGCFLTRNTRIPQLQTEFSSCAGTEHFCLFTC